MLVGGISDLCKKLILNHKIDIQTIISILYLVSDNMDKQQEIQMQTNPLVAQYIETLTDKEFHSYVIAKDLMGSLFNIVKTNGFLAWKKKMNL